MFLFLFTISLILIDLYAFQALRVLTNQKWIYISYWGINFLTLGFFLGFRFWGFRKISRWIFVIYGCFFIANYFSKVLVSLTLLIDDSWRSIKWVANHFQSSKPNSQAFDLSRSRFLSQLGVGIAVLPPVAMTWGIISGAHDYRIRRKTLYFKNLPSAFDGLKILQLSDIHAGSFWNKTAVRSGVEAAIDQKADIFFFTGDLVNNKALEMTDFIDIFKDLSAPLGCFSILGNHDYGDYVPWPNKASKSQNLQMLKDIHKVLGWRLLLNEHITLKIAGQIIALIGVENWGYGRFSKYGNLAKSYRGAENFAFQILLSHDPSHWQHQIITDKRFQKIDLTLSGHTHGMQFGVKIGSFEWSPVKYRYKYWGGLYRENNQYLYVNRGFGYIGYPGRLGMPPEITVLECKTKV